MFHQIFDYKITYMIFFGFILRLYPQDTWCATNRKIVGDTTFRLTNNPKRTLEEVLYDNVDYLWKDLSNNIYSREKNINEIINL